MWALLTTFAQTALGRNDGVQALRQPGSTLKSFLYQLALENRTIKPNSILADVPTRYPIPGAKVYSPVDYNEKFHGPVRVRAALANSLNIPAVKVLEKVGVPTFLNRLHDLGFVHLNESADYYGLGLALGSGEVNLWELARAYLTLARAGNRIELGAIKTDSLLRSEIGHSTVTPLPPSPTWNLVRDMLSDPYARSLSFGVDSVLRTVVEEYFAPADLAEYARSAETPFQLSPEYDEWLAGQPEAALTAGELRILTPREDAYFVAAEGARLAFKIAAPADKAVEWRLNGRPLETTAEREVFWPMESGDWALEVKSGALSDRVRFQVRSPDEVTEKRGFSVVKPGED